MTPPMRPAGRLSKLTLLLVLPALLAPAGCISGLFRRSAGYDQRSVTIQTVSLFNQRTPSRLSKKLWKGDWIFRRDRLDMIDEDLRRAKPDIVLLQEVLAKRGSSAESDRLILQAGALAGYSWREAQVEEFVDTREVQSQAIAVGVSLAFVDAKTPLPLDPPAPVLENSPASVATADEAATEAEEAEEAAVPQSAAAGERDSWVMGAGGFLMAATVEHEGQPLAVFNVQLPPHSDSNALWYSFIQERIQERIARYKICPKRVIVAGLMPVDESARRFRDFHDKLGLRDVASGFCQIDSRCYTATPTNEMFMATVGDESPSRLDRIFVHASALIVSSGRNFDDSDPSNRYVREFGLTRLWPTQRFGWFSNVRFARCTDDELEAGIL